MDISVMETLGLPILTIVAGIVTALITSQGFWGHLSTKSRKDSALPLNDFNIGTIVSSWGNIRTNSSMWISTI